MKIIKPSFEIIRPRSQAEGIQSLQFIEEMGRISHRTEERQTDTTWEKFIQTHVMKHGDWSITEHSQATVVFRVSRGTAFEMVRHRLFSFTQESTRFVNGSKKYPDGLEFVFPGAAYDADGFVKVEYYPIMESFVQSEKAYIEALSAKVRPQEARAVLPNALAATIAVTGNFRNWRHFFLMRTSLETHPDMRQVTDPLLELFQERIPLLYDDVTAGERQIVAMERAR